MMTRLGIIATVADITRVPMQVITGREISRKAYTARFLAIAAVRHCYPKQILAVTGQHFNRDHSGILYAMRRHRDLLLTEPDYVATWNQILTSITPNHNQP